MSKINVIFSLDYDVAVQLKGATEGSPLFPYLKEFHKIADWNGEVPEFRIVEDQNGSGKLRIAYQATIDSIEQFYTIKSALEFLDAPNPIWVGYTDSGLQYGYKFIEDEEGTKTIVREKQINPETGGEENVPILYPFDFEEYKYFLKDIIVYNESMEEVSRRRPTDEEARNTHINKFLGDFEGNGGERDIADHSGIQ